MREFNVTGPCDPASHFTVRREELIKAGMAKVEAGKYFTIFAPRQAGKTTYFLELLREIQNTPKNGFLPIWITIEELRGNGQQFFEFFKIHGRRGRGFDWPICGRKRPTFRAGSD